MNMTPSTTLTRLCAAAAYLSGIPSTALAQGTPPATIATKTTGLERREGFLPLYLDGRTGKLLLEIPRDSTRALLLISQATGLGSNPIGVDRGASDASYVVRFDRDGDRVLALLENWKYRSSALDHAAHQRSISEAFPASTMAAMPLVAEEGGRLLVDATDFAVRDWTDVVGTIARAQQGNYSMARDRSGITRAFTRNFPDNTEIDVSVTYALAGGRPGFILSGVVPDPRAFTLRQHLTLHRLPDANYQPREWDPRVGYFGVTFQDYAQPIQQPLQVRWIARHRLERVNPRDPSSPIKNPIVYYLDPGIPEPLRTASLEGAKFWEQAFDQAGLKGGFRAELLPDGVDPMDARYNVVQWENRNERGWSVGGALEDPRTGEILKGMARLDSHRARTDYNLYAGLMGAEPAAADTHFVLARVRQVTSHEIGHTLGLQHNYIASTYERGSVMDYPPPRVRLAANGDIDIASAYASGPGPYDVWVIRWGYGIFPPESEKDSLRAIVADGLRRGYLYLSDADARPEFASDPRTNLWDDAATSAEFLRHEMGVRRVAIQRFGLRNIRAGEPIALLQERFAPVYFMHRFALNSLSKTIGGMEYSNAVRGDVQQATKPIGRAQQLEALALLERALQPQELAIPDTVLTLMAPGANVLTPQVELFGSRTRPAFDELGAARTLAQMVVDMVLQRERAARLVQFSTRPNQLSLSTVIDSLVAATWRRGEAGSPKLAALQRVAQRALTDRLILLAADSAAAPEVRGIADLKLAELRAVARTRAGMSGSAIEARAHWSAVADDIGRWIEKREVPALSPALVAPPGDPFGLPEN
ncbi:MAG TPA: zinc-dependent metalloprotease [Gemmatimonadaceae bacterium]|nr:zinc-dependent metalloprotease [Gemmatimonadaceae bacterium]